MKGRIPRPVPGNIVSGFGPNQGPFNTSIVKHGVTFRTKAGVDVRAVLDGEVIYTGWLKGYGNIIIINHGRRYYTLTGGLSGITVKAGEWVRQGDALGGAPKAGSLDKKDIYFEIRHGGKALDPAPWLGKEVAG